MEATEGCDELEDGTVEQLDIDPEAKRFVAASREVSLAMERVNDDVFAACAAIATDLGAEDTWSGEETLAARISNDADTGACDVAVLEVDERMTEASRADVGVRLAIAKGECRLDYDAQVDCDQECAQNTTCEPGEFEARCEPGSISAICDGSCAAGAFCVGSADVSANCMGKCEALCVGECAGTCYHENGEVTENDPNCRGKCTSACNGECFGECKVDVEPGIACGAGVYCRGTCDGVTESPACVTDYEPPECDVDTTCYESCTARIATEKAECTPATVTVIADVEASGDLQPLVQTLNENLPIIVEAAEAEGRLVQRAGTRMADAGRDLNDRIDDVDGKSLACVGAATTSLADAVDTITVSVDASLELQGELEVSAEETSADETTATDADTSAGGTSSEDA